MMGCTLGRLHRLKGTTFHAVAHAVGGSRVRRLFFRVFFDRP